MTNEQRAEQIIVRYGFDFENINKADIINLIEKEIDDFQEGSSEYIRLLCGYLLCIGDESDSALIEKVKHGINFDVECMIDGEWIDSLKGIDKEYTRSRDEIIESFISYYSKELSQNNLHI